MRRDAETVHELGLRTMSEFYNWAGTDGEGDIYRYLTERLFADIWNRPYRSRCDRRLLLIGALRGSGQTDVLSVQFPAASSDGELYPDQLGEVASFPASYLGWTLGGRLHIIVEDVIGKGRPARAAKVKRKPD